MRINRNISRRLHLLGLLVYFPELREIVAGTKIESVGMETLRSLLQPDDNEIIVGISIEEEEAARGSLCQSFAGDYPVGF